jgi:hypothetical protein
MRRSSGGRLLLCAAVATLLMALASRHALLPPPPSDGGGDDAATAQLRAGSEALVASPAPQPTPAPTPPRPCTCRVKDVLLDFAETPASLRAFKRPAASLCAETGTLRMPRPITGGGFDIPAVRHAAILGPVEAKALLIVPLETCPTHLWHGTVEFLLPAIATLQWNGIAPRGVHLAVTLPRDAQTLWRYECPTLRRAPFGFFEPQTVSHALQRIFFSAITVFDAGGIRVWGGMEDGGYGQIVGRSVVVGLNVSCGQVPPLAHPPFYLLDSDRTHPFVRACAGAQRYLVDALRSHEPIPRGARPLVVYWGRAVVARKNGRYVTNRNEMLDALRNVSEARGYALKVIEDPEALSPSAQQDWVRAADVLVAPRGAGSVFAAALRSGAGFVSLFPVAARAPVTRDNDNFPWWPLPLVRSDIAVRAVPCLAELPVNGTEHDQRNCLSRSVNFCDMRCPATVAARRLDEVLVQVAGGNVSWAPPAMACPQGPCFYTELPLAVPDAA